MAELYIFFRDGFLDCACESVVFAAVTERHLETISDNIRMVSVTAPTVDDCWVMFEHVLRFSGLENAATHTMLHDLDHTQMTRH